MRTIPPHVQVTLCRTLAVTAAVAAPLWFGAMAYSLLAGNRKANLWMAEAMGTPGGIIAGLVLWLLFALPYGPLFFVLPLNGRFTRREKWLWFGAMIAAGFVALGHAAFAAFWWTLAGRMERGERARPLRRGSVPDA
ncbi:hypothetical protein [Alienimonas sp. DA493]|uniref:hypothetical protein n=1 Tax=Alienimonas sp. DA493 TaxID=3373605 RepID=UPI003753FE93